MRFGFKFSGLCGTVYAGGNVVFSKNTNSLLSSVGNRVTVFDIKANRSYTLPFENRSNIACIAVSPDGLVLLTIDVDGYAVASSLPRRCALHRINFKGRVRFAKFSPDGRYFALGIDQHVEIWQTPRIGREFTPFVLHKRYTGFHDKVTCLDWSPDSSYIIAGCRDATSKIFTLEQMKGFVPIRLAGHKDAVVLVKFITDASNKITHIYSVSRDGAVIVWRKDPSPALESHEDDGRTERSSEDGGTSSEGESTAKGAKGSGARSQKRKRRRMTAKTDVRGVWRIEHKHFFNMPNTKVTCADFADGPRVLAVGFSTGVFGLWELPSFTQLQTLSISSNGLDSACFNATGDWLAFASEKQGQLLVWEWRSETYTLKQQGHQHLLRCCEYSPDGQWVVTGSEDGKVKLWNTESSFCIVTFTEHTGPVTGTCFVPNGTAVLSASLDGTVRAHDTLRYRNFRTYTSPSPTQFSCVTVDPSGEIVCAGTQTGFEVYVWSVQTGKLLDILSGHAGPVSHVCFSPTAAVLASSSWDKGVRIWDVFSGKGSQEQLEHEREVVTLAYRPDGKEICTSTMDGKLHFWDTMEAALLRSIEGRYDVAGGRLPSDRMSTKKSISRHYFTSVAYSADGTCVIAGGNSRFVCIYDAKGCVMLKRFTLSHNRSLAGIVDQLNSKNMTEAGPLDELDLSESDNERRWEEEAMRVPGAQRKDLSTRKTAQAIRSLGVAFCRTGRAFAAATTEGLMLYSLDENMYFDPTDLDIEVTTESVRSAIKEKEYARALVLALRLNESDVLLEALYAVPVSEVEYISRIIPQHHFARFVSLVAEQLEDSPHFEFLLLWIRNFLEWHGTYFRSHVDTLGPALKAAHRVISSHYRNLSSLCSENKYTLQYLRQMPLDPESDASSDVGSNADEMSAESDGGGHAGNDNSGDEGGSSSGEGSE
eukprot:Rmarinus@m.290